MLFVIWQPFLLSLGISVAFLGLLESLFHFHRGLVTSFTQLIGGFLSDIIGRKSVLIISSGLAIVTFLLLITTSLTYSFYLLLLAMIFKALVAISRPARSAMIAESVKESERGMAYSMSILSIMLPGLFASVIGGFIVDKMGYTAIFLIAIFIESLCFMLFLSLEETLSGKLKSKFSLRDVLVPRKELLGFYIATAADIFAWGLGFALLFAILTESFGFTKFQLGLMYSLFLLAWISSQLYMGKLLGKHKCKTLLALSDLIGIFVLIGFLFSREFWLFALLHIPMGLVAAAWTPAMLTYAAGAAPEEERAKVIGGLSAFRGIAGFMAPFIGGILYEKWGFSAPLLANLLAVIVALGLIVTLIRED